MAHEVPSYCNGPKSNYVWCERVWNFECELCGKIATPEHCQSRRHLDRLEWVPHANPSETARPQETSAPTSCSVCQEYLDPHTNKPYYLYNALDFVSWTKPPFWMKQWLDDVRQGGILTAKMIFDVCGGPSLTQGMPPPRSHVLGCYDSPPTCEEVKGFFGDETYIKLRNCAEKVGQRHAFIKCFTQPSAMRVVVYTDCLKTTQTMAYHENERGWWFPCLCIYMGGEYHTWCVAAAKEGCGTAWKTHPSRINRYRHNQEAPPPPPPADPATAETPANPFTTSSVVIEELGSTVFGMPQPPQQNPDSKYVFED